MSARFDLEKAIAAWRRTFTYHRAFLKEDVDELERHLRDHVAHLIAAGAKPVDAFKEALRTLGDFTGAAAEYRKVYWGKIKRRRRLLREVIWHLVMLNNYLKVALRNLRRQPVYTVINVAGLAIGLTCFALLILFVQDELSYDRFHDNADRIYRMVVDVEASQGVQHTAKSPPIWANAIITDFPEVASAVRFQTTRQGWMVRYNDRRFSEKTWTFADSTVFEVFDVPLVRGNPATALVAPYTVVLSEARAAKYFPDEDPMGKTLTLDNQYDFEVTGVMQDMPPNAHFHFDFLASYTSTKDPPYIYTLDLSTVNFPITYTYMLLRDREAAATFEAKLPALVDKLTPPQPGRAMHAALQPLTDIHLHSRLQDEIEANGDPATVYIFLAIAVFVLLIACVNFMNLATARSALRAREVGMRKVVGAQRHHLVLQFLGEAVLMAVLALAIALGSVQK